VQQLAEQEAGGTSADDCNLSFHCRYLSKGLQANEAGRGLNHMGLGSPAFLLTEFEKEGQNPSGNCTFENTVRLSSSSEQPHDSQASP
jgi:hypothetical protein